MRWKITLRYLGTHFTGWQRQNEPGSVQQFIEEAFSTILRQLVSVTGCGRTDTGVHATHYVAHADFTFNGDLHRLMYQVNAILPKDIAIMNIETVSSNFHARYDAVSRHYTYYLHFEKNPFLQGQSFYYTQSSQLDWPRMQEAASVLLEFDSFKSFCKTDSGVANYKCNIMHASWEFDGAQARFRIEANRFLRGMVRLIVGATLQVGVHKIHPEDIRNSLTHQTPIPFAWSVPGEGLFLDRIKYSE